MRDIHVAKGRGNVHVVDPPSGNYTFVGTGQPSDSIGEEGDVFVWVNLTNGKIEVHYRTEETWEYYLDASDPMSKDQLHEATSR